ncbi:unnamed protein product [Onchocerca flexuosa]|uniref:Transmembrane protein n=1 Tax=Onchocerca flexuosa TaxID=387005 RepID=A0A183I0H3_9BILA|nr:unnamed protein product [Onchocerca flexuosa]
MWRGKFEVGKMTDMRNMEDDNANDLPMDQSAVAFDDVLDELLEPDRVLHAGHFLGICSTEGWISAVLFCIYDIMKIRAS